MCNYKIEEQEERSTIIKLPLDTMIITQLCKKLQMLFWIGLISLCTPGSSFCFQPVSLYPITTSNSRIISSSLRSTTDKFSEDVKIELVSTKKRALEVKIFRQLSVTPEEYILKKKQEATELYMSISEEKAIDLLMPGYDDEGNYVKITFKGYDQQGNKIEVAPSDGEEIYFAAIHSRTTEAGNNSPNPLYIRQNGIVGVVRAEKKHLDSTNTLESFRENMGNVPAHVYLSNLSVHETQRRQGIGTKLLSAVASYAGTIENVCAVLLDVDIENSGAIRMYEEFGFVWLYRNEKMGTMFIRV